MSDDPKDELRAIQQRARKNAIRRWVVMGPGMATMIVVWVLATFVVGWLPGAIIGGIAGALVSVGLEKALPGPTDDE